MLPSDLYKRCSSFCKSALRTEENTEPFLKELSDEPSFKKRVELAEDKFEKLGEGSSRVVFKIDENLILKVAFNDKGIAQNQSEMRPELQKSCTNNAILADAKGKWIIFPFTESIEEPEFKKIIGFSLDPFMNALFYKFNNESDKWLPPRDYEEIEKHPFFTCLAEAVFSGDLLIGDLDKISSYGKTKDGNIVLRDAGLSKSVFNEFYKTKSKSKSDSKSEGTES